MPLHSAYHLYHGMESILATLAHSKIITRDTTLTSVPNTVQVLIIILQINIVQCMYINILPNGECIPNMGGIIKGGGKKAGKGGGAV